jgi:hypothetical protein
MTVVKFPYSASRRVYARRPRIPKNGTPEERAAKAGTPRRSCTRSTSREEIRARVRLIAAERNLPTSEIKWIGRLKTYDCVSFSKRHRVSVDWLICGDLKGLLETMRGCPSRSHRPVLTPADEDGAA